MWVRLLEYILFGEHHLARWCSRLARQPVTLEVDGSSPFRVATKSSIQSDGAFLRCRGREHRPLQFRVYIFQPTTRVVGFSFLSTSNFQLAMIKYQSVRFCGFEWAFMHILWYCVCVSWTFVPTMCDKIHKKVWKKRYFSLVLSLTIMENNTILFRVGRVIQC